MYTNTFKYTENKEDNMTKKEKERQELKELWDKVTFTVEPRKTKIITAGKITTYKANKN